MGADDLEIRLQAANPHAIPEGLMPEADPTLCMRPFGTPQQEAFPVYFHESVLRTVDGHAATHPEREVGGVLLGRRLAVRGDRVILLVERCIPGLKAEGTATRLTFTHETWQEINAVRERDFPTLTIVGWYHSHPDLAIFLSRDDLYIHKNFFRADWQIAYVVDPINRDRGVFTWQGEALVRSTGMRIYQQVAERERLKQYLAALSPPVRSAVEPPREHATGDAKPISVYIEFQDASISPFAWLPRGGQQFFGITNIATAPRISLKNLIIVCLVMAIAVVLSVDHSQRQLFDTRIHRLETVINALNKNLHKSTGSETSQTPPATPIPPVVNATK